MNFLKINRGMGKKKSFGFTIVELMVVIMIIAILAIVGLPALNSVLISGRVEPTANDLRIGIANMRKNFSVGSTPYSTLGTGAASTAVFANMMRGPATALNITGSGSTTTLQHSLGATNSQITVAQSTLVTAGDSFSITVPDANAAACPDLAAIMGRAVDQISINGTTVKANGGTYNSTVAANACKDGDSNSFVFTVR